MSSLNKVMIIGRLGADPDVRYTQSNAAVANMSVATTDRYKDRNGELQENTEWHRVVVWNRLAEICQEYLKKGSLVYFEGKLETRGWEDKEGQKRYTTEIKAFNMQMLDSRGDQSGGGAPQNSSGGKTAKASVDLDDSFDDMDDDLPF
ncbi:single-stranded DNA-binding protein [Rhodohalobacter sp.]|uniref:single-stranded DNA-binding protein n=1 Tax=Rhodohalobacter sp. TaxID=1974210 RepID=UPI0035687672